MNIPVPVSCSQLLKEVHVSKLKIIMFVYMKSKPCEKPVLIKIIIDYLLSHIHLHFIIKH